jgi:hypothetical protein
MQLKTSKVSEPYEGGDTEKRKANFYPLMLAAVGIMVLNIIINPGLISFTAFSFTILGTVSIAWRRELDGFFNCLIILSERYKVTTPALILVCTFFVIDALAKRAQAQFFQNAETWMTGQFAGAGEAIPLVFNVLRGLFILYLGISLVRVVQAGRQDEDWQNLARTPMIILIAVTMGDILANLIIGGGGGGGGP